MKYLSILFLLVTACAKHNTYYIQQPFQPGVTKFERLFKVTVTVDIIFTHDLPDRDDAICHYGAPGHNIIMIKPQSWYSLTTAAQEQLLFHELGHCVFNLKHNEKLIVRNGTIMPQSIMFPMTFADSYPYATNQPYYYEELEFEAFGVVEDIQ